MLASDVKVAKGGAQTAMPHQALDGMEIDARLEQVGGKFVFAWMLLWWYLSARAQTLAT